MNFRRSPRNAGGNDLEINVIPLIDILLVMLIFLASTTAFTRYTALEVQLPQAAPVTPMEPGLTLAISQDGRYALDGQLVQADTPADLAQALRASAPAPDTRLSINADGRAAHQAVVHAMEAARLAGISRVEFMAQSVP